MLNPDKAVGEDTGYSSHNNGCKKCNRIYTLLNNHVMTEHNNMIGNNGILNNILLNILSLMIGPPPRTLNPSLPLTPKDTEPQMVSLRVISKTDDCVAMQQDGSSYPTSSSQSSFAISTSSEFSANHPSEQTAKFPINPDLLSNLFNNATTTSPTLDFQSTSSHSPEIAGRVVQLPSVINLEELTNVIQGGHETTFFGPDGNLTQAGLSLLLANQQKNQSGSGKSDLDVADILVNKMPIPSLNKALDPSLLQTLYLQQLALANQSIPLTANHENNNSGSPILSGINVDTSNMILKSVSSEGLVNTLSTGKSNVTNSRNESLQEVIEKHKQLSELIEAAMNKKQKNEKITNINQYLSASFSPDSYTKSSVIEKRGSNVRELNNNQHKILSFPMLQHPHIIRKQPPITSTIMNASERLSNNAEFISNQSAKSRILVDTDEQSTPRTSSSVLTISSENILNLFKSQPAESKEQYGAHFFRQKNGVFSHSFVQKDLLGNLVMNSTQDVSPEQTNNIAEEPKSSRKKRFSSVSMVPISEYNPQDPNNEPLASRVPSPSSLKVEKLLYKCEACGVTFSVLATLETHMKSHASNKTEQCSYCNLTFTDQQKYFEHLTSHRGEENVFRCNFCPKIFTSKGDFNKHFTKHTQRRPYLCSHCQKPFKDPGSLTKHERIHTGEQPYVCPECNRGFAEKSSLRKHMRVHSGEKPYKCEECDKCFSISGNLQRHMFIHTGAKPFKCTQCSKAFNNPSHLRRHVKNVHHGKMENKDEEL